MATRTGSFYDDAVMCSLSIEPCQACTQAAATITFNSDRSAGQLQLRRKGERVGGG